VKGKTTVVIQARMGSTRLPGKIMKKLCGKTILAHDIARISQARNVDEIVIATTTALADEAVACEAEKIGVKWHRGSEEDVLSRTYGAARDSGAHRVVRITSDCPLYDWFLLDSMLDVFATGDCDYLSNCQKRSFPRGLDTEIFTFDALTKAHAEAVLPHEREHVTPYIYQHPELFRLKNHAQAQDLSRYRWTLDTPEDWAFISAVYERLFEKNPLFTTADILKLLSDCPELSMLNAHIEQKKLA